MSWALCFFDADEETKKLTGLNQPHEIENLLIRMLQDTGHPTPDLHFTLQTSTLHDYMKEKRLTPPPCFNHEFAAFTIASTFSFVRSF